MNALQMSWIIQKGSNSGLVSRKLHSLTSIFLPQFNFWLFSRVWHDLPASLVSHNTEIFQMIRLTRVEQMQAKRMIFVVHSPIQKALEE